MVIYEEIYDYLKSIFIFIHCLKNGKASQYASNEFRSILEINPLIIRSMSRKGNCWDNAVAESFFKTLKAECIYQNKFVDKHHAAIVVFEYIEVWYNRKRMHSALGFMSPEEFGRKLNEQNIAA